MAKTKRKQVPPQEASHLESTLEDLTTTTAVQVKKYRMPLLIAVIAILAIALGVSATRSVQRNRRDAVQARFYNLFVKPIASEKSPDEAGLQAFLAEIRGAEPEKYMIKEWVSYQLDEADRLDRSSPTDGKPAATDQGRAESLRQKALTLSKELAERYPDAANLQAWKDAVKKRVDAATDTSWRPAIPTPPETTSE